ncbi:MAG TPA: hypothetical protein VLL25_08430, partial [Acidimicrobiales bacterium]|nr:hypothetical protein [Acidimicrobiales bacterium]
MPRPDRLNRLGLLLLGLLLVAAGGYGLARSYGALGHGRQHDPVLIAGLRSFIAENRGWFWWGAGATCVLITLIGLA